MRRLGFTLLEVLIAMAIFSIVGLASFQLLKSVRGIDRATNQQTAAYRELVRSLSIMDRDFIQLVYREIRDELGDRRAAVSVNEGYYPIELTRQGWNNPLQRPRSELQRVGYQVVEGELQRHLWFVLDRAEDTEPVVQSLMKGIQGLSVYLVMPDGDRQESISADDLDELPVAIELTISTDIWGDVTRFYDLPVFVAEVAGAVIAPGDEEDQRSDEGAERPQTEPSPASPPPRPSSDSGVDA